MCDFKPSYHRIQDLEKSERPRERLVRLGAEVLTNAELLAILLRTGIKSENSVQIGQNLLTRFYGLRGLQRAGLNEITVVRGVGEAKAAQIKAAIEIGKRLSVEIDVDRPAVTCPSQAAELVKYEMAGLTQENLWVLILDVRLRLISIEKLYIGSLTMSTVRIGEIFKVAIVKNAISIIVVHNHPSGDPTPSPDDVVLTRNIVRAAKLLDIEMSDHIIIGQGRYASMKQLNLGFEAHN
jgi:DNA repair protein RadC